MRGLILLSWAGISPEPEGRENSQFQWLFHSLVLTLRHLPGGSASQTVLTSLASETLSIKLDSPNLLPGQGCLT